MAVSRPTVVQRNTTTTQKGKSQRSARPAVATSLAYESLPCPMLVSNSVTDPDAIVTEDTSQPTNLVLELLRKSASGEVRLQSDVPLLWLSIL
mmetsp:Transcript_28067/g.66913  ORF Transcript_28067/g.66913 Transcript_28067/m.66913 type:complete len:93 (+) Transcript_28067:317-595(+)